MLAVIGKALLGLVYCLLTLSFEVLVTALRTPILKVRYILEIAWSSFYF